MLGVSEGRRFATIVLLFIVGFGMVALADLVRAWWPLFLTPIPYAAIPYLLVHADDPETRTPSEAAEGRHLTHPT
jgi:hypothetical protein